MYSQVVNNFFLYLKMGEKKGRIEKNEYNFHSVRKNSPKNH